MGGESGTVERRGAGAGGDSGDGRTAVVAGPVLGPPAPVARPLDWYPLAERDPVPGDPDAVLTAAAHHDRVADAVAQAARDLRRIADATRMCGRAVDAFCARARDTADDLAAVEPRYREAVAALLAYAGVLGDAQAESRAALRQAQEAEERRVAAAASLAAATTGGAVFVLSPLTVGPDADRLRGEATARRDRCRRALADAEADLSVARARCERAVGDRDGAAEAAMRALHEVRQRDGLDTTWAQRTLDAVTTVSGLVATVAGIAALACLAVPFVGAPVAATLGTVALVAGVVNLTGTLVQRSQGRTSWGEVAWSAGGVVTLGAGRALLAPARAVRAVGAVPPTAAARGAGTAGRTSPPGDPEVAVAAAAGALRTGARLPRPVPDVAPAARGPLGETAARAAVVRSALHGGAAVPHVVQALRMTRQAERSSALGRTAARTARGASARGKAERATSLVGAGVDGRNATAALDTRDQRQRGRRRADLVGSHPAAAAP